MWSGSFNFAKPPKSYGIYFSKVTPLRKSFSYYFKFFYGLTKVEDFSPFRDRTYGLASFTNKIDKRPDISDPRVPDYRPHVLQWKNWVSARDLLINIQSGKSIIYAEVYNPHYVARQLGFTQAWPVLLPSSSHINAPSHHKTLSSSDADALNKWQRKIMEGIHVTPVPNQPGETHG
ncbi:hypothetical protein LINPERHAP2_LOCUS15562 [Linum perenne]